MKKNTPSYYHDERAKLQGIRRLHQKQWVYLRCSQREKERELKQAGSGLKSWILYKASGSSFTVYNNHTRLFICIYWQLYNTKTLHYYDTSAILVTLRYYACKITAFDECRHLANSSQKIKFSFKNFFLFIFRSTQKQHFALSKSHQKEGEEEAEEEEKNLQKCEKKEHRSRALYEKHLNLHMIYRRIIQTRFQIHRIGFKITLLFFFLSLSLFFSF